MHEETTHEAPVNTRDALQCEFIIYNKLARVAGEWKSHTFSQKSGWACRTFRVVASRFVADVRISIAVVSIAI